MKQNILLTKRGSLHVKEGRKTASLQDPRALTFQAELMRLGYIMSEDLLSAVSTLSDTNFKALYQETLPILRNQVGDDVLWEPMYPNFPRQVLEMDLLELYLNAIAHYWTCGTWKPLYEKEVRLPEFEFTEFKELTLAGDDDKAAIFAEILRANASVAPADMKILEQLMVELDEKTLLEALPEEIPFKETLCWFVGACLKNKWNGLGMLACKTPTDILRVATALAGGDVSLAENTRFKSLSRPLRRAFMQRLEAVIGGRSDDIFRHRGKWVRLAHSLHAGDYAEIAPKACKVIRDARSSKVKPVTFNSKLELAFEGNDRMEARDLMVSRPGVFARHLDHAIRKFGPRGIVTPFLGVAEEVDTRVLLQLYGHFNARTKPVTKRAVFPKSARGKSRLLTQTLPALRKETVEGLRSGIDDVLTQRFCERDMLGETAYIDPAMKDCPIPLSLRSASDGLITVARGTKLPIGDKDTLRMFIYWKGQDIDLSGYFTNADFTTHDEVAYYNLRTGGKSAFAVHSGDIVNAPNGASEFIDVNIAQALAKGHRYLVMTVYVYSGPNFCEHDVCYAGWMSREHPGSNEIYDPKTVEQKVDLTAASRNAMPVIFDLKERKAIWMDLATNDRGAGMHRPNNLRTNSVSLRDSVEMAMNLQNKPTLYDLFMMHVQARCDFITTDREEADITFAWDGDVKPTDTTTILSEYL